MDSHPLGLTERTYFLVYVYTHILSCVSLFHSGFLHIRVHTPGATESATVGNNLSCMMCSSPLKEDVKSRVLGGETEVWSVCSEYRMTERKLFHR